MEEVAKRAWEYEKDGHYNDRCQPYSMVTGLIRRGDGLPDGIALWFKDEWERFSTGSRFSLPDSERFGSVIPSLSSARDALRDAKLEKASTQANLESMVSTYLRESRSEGSH